MDQIARIAQLIVRKRKGYVPVMAKNRDGAYILVDPIYCVNLDAEEITGALEKAIAAGHPPFPDVTAEEWRKRVDPTLKAAKVKSWKKLAQGGASCALDWARDEVTVFMSRLDRQGRFVDDPAKKRVLPKDTSLRELVEIIMEDIRSRPELWEE